MSRFGGSGPNTAPGEHEAESLAAELEYVEAPHGMEAPRPAWLGNPLRRAIVSGARSVNEVAAYLPENYTIVAERLLLERVVYVIEGRDVAGWGLDTYVKPRLASGMMGCVEIDA